MSDGNFNRSLLPANTFRSGLRAGKSQMRQHALLAFEHTLHTTLPHLSPEEHNRLLAIFHLKLAEAER